MGTKERMETKDVLGVKLPSAAQSKGSRWHSNQGRNSEKKGKKRLTRNGSGNTKGFLLKRGH